MAPLNSPFKCNIREFVVDEIALEGLEGIGINLLWRRLEARISAPVTDKMKNRLWSFIVNSENISIYELPEPVPDLEIIDRLTLVDQETGYMLDPDDYLDGPYEYQPIEDAYGCSLHYNTRVLLDDQIAESPYEKVIAKYGLKMVLVASLNERWRALAPQLPFFYLQHLGPLHFCMLELIGRSRENGQMTTGKTNLTKIVKDPKILFYHRKTLQKLDLVRITYITQVTAERTIKSLLIRLKRFHKTDVLTVPKSGKIHDLVNYLKAQPDFCEKTDVVMKKGLMTSAQNKKFQKKVSIFHFEEEPIPCDKLTPKERKRNIEAATSIETPKVKSEPDKKSTPKETPKKPMRKRYMYLVSKSDESSQSEDEEVQQPLKCQYKVGVNILRQAYERFLEAGRAGLTQNELAELIGVEFYVSRTICRIFKTKNIVREFMECRGRQRISRYIAIVATSKMDSKVAEEKEKLRKLLDKGHSLCKKEQRSKPNADSDSETPIVKKKIKLENDTIKPSEINISEVELIDGVKNGNKQLSLKTNLTLRQLKFSSGILKVIHDKTFVLGYQTLSNLVAKDYNEPPMDTKAMKLLLQGMVSGGNLKIYKLKMPRVQHQYSVIICAPHIKPNHPLLREKYKDLVHKITTTQSLQKKIKSGIRPLSQYAYPRYVKVQKLHEALIKIIYFNDVKKESTESPDGFISIKDFLPELPVDVALGHLTSGSLIDVSSLKLDDNLLNAKICNAPTDLYRSLLNSKNLHSSLRSTLKVLASFGLVQLIVLSSAEALEFPDNSMTINWFYVSKHAKIIDTTGVWPRANVDIANLEREFNFDSLEAVQDYWNSVYIISTNTTIDIPNRKKTLQVRPPVRTKIQALELGKFGPRYGNGIGPCGFDSSFFIDMPRLWKSYCSRSLKFKQVSKPPVNIPKFERPKRLARVQKKKKPPIKKIVKKPEVVAEIVKQANYRQRQHTKKKAKEIVWTLEEDRILMMCKAAITIMSPISQPGCLQVRNLVAKDILSMRDPRKTQSICHRRSLVVELNSTLTHERNCILNELRRHRLVSKYEGILKKIRILYCTNMARYINEARLPMLELVWIIHEVSKNITEQQELPSVALSFEDFHKNYFIVQSSANTLCNLYKTPCISEADIVIGTLKEAIVMTVMHTFNHVMQKSGAKLIYTYFRRFPETVLRVAIEPLRKCGAIAAKEKLINAHMHYVNLDDIAQCSYKISANYQRKWISRLNAEFVDSLTDCFYGNFTKNAIKATPDTNCFCFELQAKDLIEIVAKTAPVIAGPSGSIIQEEQLNVIDIATNYKLKSGTLGWENKTTRKFSDCYKEIKIGDALDYLARRSFIRNEDVRETKMKHAIVSYLKKKRQNGATFKDLQSYLNYERKKLIADLSELQNNNIIRRVGFYGNVVVLMEYVKDWTMDVSGGQLIPLPWLTLKSEMRNEIFFKWAGVVMNKVFECPTCSIANLSDMAEFLTSRAVQDICELLQKCDCVTLHTFTVKELSLYSDDDETPAELDEYNEFESPENIVVMPAVDCLVKYAFLRNIVLNS